MTESWESLGDSGASLACLLGEGLLAAFGETILQNCIQHGVKNGSKLEVACFAETQQKLIFLSEVLAVFFGFGFAGQEIHQSLANWC